MRPTPIPDDEVQEGYTRLVMGPPDGDPTGDIRPVEVQAAMVNNAPVFLVRYVLDPGDAERLANGEPFWLTMWGHVVPFSIHLMDSTEEAPDATDT